MCPAELSTVASVEEIGGTGTSMCPADSVDPILVEHLSNVGAAEEQSTVLMVGAVSGSDLPLHHNISCDDLAIVEVYNHYLQ